MKLNLECPMMNHSYDLSWDEVRVIDHPEFGLSKEAYEAIKLE